MLQALRTGAAYVGAATSGSHSLLLRSDGESVAFGDNSWYANRSHGRYLGFVPGASIYQSEGGAGTDYLFRVRVGGGPGGVGKLLSLS